MKVVDRETLFEMIKTELFPESVNHNKRTRIGVIIGPSGSDKSYAVQNTCHENPEGVLYFEIVNADTFVAELCSTVGMKMSPATVFDLALGYISDQYAHYHTVSDDQVQAFGEVMSVLRTAASRYKGEFGKVPVLIIDRVFLKDAAVAFLKFTSRDRENKLEREVYSKFHDDDEMAGLKADSLMFYHVYADLVMLAKSTELKKICVR